MTAEVLFAGGAVALAVCGIYFLQASCRAKVNAPRRVLAGWLAIFGSIMLWSMTSGADKGTAFGIVAGVLLVLAWLCFSALRSDFAGAAADKTERLGCLEPISGLTYVRRVWAACLMGPIAGFSSLAICTFAFTAFRALGLEHTLNLTLVSFGLPIIWAMLAVLGGYGRSVWRKSVALLLAGIIPAALLSFTVS